MEFGEYTLFAMETAKRAGQELCDRFRTRHEVKRKSTDIDLVTEADVAAEKVIVAAIEERFPDHYILAEEGTAQDSLQSDWLWLIDPLDGTVNYAHGFPIFAVSIALAHQGRILSGVVYDPYLESLFVAERGKGAYRDGVRLHVSEAPRLREAMLATGFPYDVATDPDNNVREFNYMVTHAQAVRRAGAASLDIAWVAAGIMDGYWEANLQPWDWAAGWLLVEEAGGKFTDYEGAPWDLAKDRVIASNGRIHDEMVEAVRRARREM